MNRFFPAVVVLFLLLSFSSSVYAQNAISGGSISGLVTDSSGAACIVSRCWMSEPIR